MTTPQHHDRKPTDAVGKVGLVIPVKPRPEPKPASRG